MLLRRAALAFATTCLALAQPALAQEWPTRPVRIVVSFPPGGSSDIVARVLAEVVSPRLGQRVVVDNRPGAGGTLAAQHVATQRPDGYTLLLSNTAPIVTSPPIYAAPGYDPVAGFTHIAFIGSAPTVIVTNASVPARDMAGLLAWIRAQRTPPAFGTSGAGSVGHILGVMFQRETGLELTHAPYRGSAPMLADLLGGSVLLSFDTLPQNVEHIRAGRLTAFAVSATARNSMAPEVPTTAELGYPGLVATNWMGVSGPAGLPPAIVTRLHAEVAHALSLAEFRARLDEHAVTPTAMTQADFAAFVARDVAQIGGSVRAMGIRAE